MFGAPPKSLVEQLNRLKSLEPADWFFNRSLSSVFVGFDCRCDKEFKGIEYKRNDIFWFKSAWKRLQNYQKKRSSKGIYERGLIKKTYPYGSMELLKAENISTEKEFLIWIESIYPSYRESYKALNKYFSIGADEGRLLFLTELEDVPDLHPEIKKALRLHATSR